jgi:hypothetical protein
VASIPARRDDDGVHRSFSAIRRYPNCVRGLPAGGSTNDGALVFNAGTGIQTGDVRITPEIRCLKWTVPRNPSSDDVAFYLRPPHDYEVQFLLGIGSSRK